MDPVEDELADFDCSWAIVFPPRLSELSVLRLSKLGLYAEGAEESDKVIPEFPRLPSKRPIGKSPIANAVTVDKKESRKKRHITSRYHLT